MVRHLHTLALALLGGCGFAGSETRCGIAALAGPSLLLEQFTKSGATLSQIPAGMPEIIPVRIAAGAAQRALVGRSDSSWVIGVDGPLESKNPPGFGVLVVDPIAGPTGLLLFEGPPIPGAPVLGQVNLGPTNLPFHGLKATVAAFQDSRCPLFPDSLRK